MTKINAIEFVEKVLIDTIGEDHVDVASFAEAKKSDYEVEVNEEFVARFNPARQPSRESVLLDLRDLLADRSVILVTNGNYLQLKNTHGSLAKVIYYTGIGVRLPSDSK